MPDSSFDVKCIFDDLIEVIRDFLINLDKRKVIRLSMAQSGTQNTNFILVATFCMFYIDKKHIEIKKI